MQQRLAESYLEVLRLVEREVQWVQDTITNQEIRSSDGGYLSQSDLVKTHEPAVTDRATIAAHLAAFGSPNVRRLYQDWRSIITAIDTENDALDRNYQENFPERLSRGPAGATTACAVSG